MDITYASDSRLGYPKNYFHFNENWKDHNYYLIRSHSAHNKYLLYTIEKHGLPDFTLLADNNGDLIVRYHLTGRDYLTCIKYSSYENLTTEEKIIKLYNDLELLELLE